MLLIFSDDTSVKSKMNRNKTMMAVSYDLLCCKGRDTRRHIPEIRKYCIYCHEDLKYCSYGLLCCKITALSWRNWKKSRMWGTYVMWFELRAFKMRSAETNHCTFCYWHNNAIIAKELLNKQSCEHKRGTWYVWWLVRRGGGVSSLCASFCWSDSWVETVNVVGVNDALQTKRETNVLLLWQATVRCVTAKCWGEHWDLR